MTRLLAFAFALLAGCSSVGLPSFPSLKAESDADGIHPREKSFVSQVTVYSIASAAEVKARAESRAKAYCADRGKAYRHQRDLEAIAFRWPDGPGRAVVQFDCE